MYKYIFIDLDDTLWDFHANARISLSEIYSTKQLYQYFDSFEQYFSIYPKRNAELWDMYGRGEVTKEFLSRERFLHPLKQVGVHNEEMAQQIATEYLEMMPTRTELVPHTREILEYLKAKYSLTIVSNGFAEVQYNKLKSTGIYHYFDHIVLSEEAKALKPDPQIFEYALQLNNANAEEVLMIGDSLATDIIGARNAGIDHVWFNPGGLKTESDVMKTITSLSELFDIL